MRIFPRISTLSTAFKCAIALAIVFTLLCSCGSTRHVTQLVRDIQRDTIFLSNTQYDSIYTYKDRMQDRSKDTVYLKDVSIEYRYKLLRDTVYKEQAVALLTCLYYINYLLILIFCRPLNMQISVALIIVFSKRLLSQQTDRLFGALTVFKVLGLL